MGGSTCRYHPQVLEGGDAGEDQSLGSGVWNAGGWWRGGREGQVLDEFSRNDILAVTDFEWKRPMSVCGNAVRGGMGGARKGQTAPGGGLG